jgi:hypothetical protein
MRTRLATAACLAAFALTPLGAGHAAAATDCGSASYGSSAPIHSTNYGVANIKATRTTCGKAKKIALASEGNGGRVYTKLGYKCKPGNESFTCTKIKKPADGPVPKVKFQTRGNG